ncbi:MAG: HAMP domain-containing sensor histidine kinase [Campylobacterota bacterium]|nr:HAMP domain-containing sensor histidine kinase [Campylobacterota bacterium]
MFKENKNFQSISNELLQLVFIFYFIITIFTTIAHFIIEYHSAQNNIKSELTMISKVFDIPLKKAMIDFDVKKLDSISSEVLKLPTVLGIELTHNNSKKKYYSKYSNNFNKNTSGVFSYKLNIFSLNKNKKSIYLGTVKYYSSSEIVLDMVKLNFTIILISSLFKSFILIILFIWAFKRFLTKPLENITKNIENVDLEKISKHQPITIDKEVNNELTFLSRAFNDMLNNLDKSLNIQKNTQKQLLESEKMVSLGNMVAGVSHEINTPVGMALTGITHLDEQTKKLKKLYENEDMSEDEFKEYLKDMAALSNSIEINLTKAASLIRSFKKVAVDQSSDTNREFNLKEYLDEILLSLHNRLKKTKIDIYLDIDEKITINSNPGAFSQIITNLITNSLIHGFENSNTTKGDIKIYAKLNLNRLNLIYKDNGKGMDNDTKRKIFDPFFTTARKDGGSGLGMSIVYNLVTSTLKGTIKVKSEPSQGILFDIDIPIDIN